MTIPFQNKERLREFSTDKRGYIADVVYGWSLEGSILGSELVLARGLGGDAPRPLSSLLLLCLAAAATGSEAWRWICSSVILEGFPTEDDEDEERLLLRA